MQSAIHFLLFNPNSFHFLFHYPTINPNIIPYITHYSSFHFLFHYPNIERLPCCRSCEKFARLFLVSIENERNQFMQDAAAYKAT